MMNSKQKRYSARYWKYTVELEEPTWDLGIKRCEWLEQNFGRKNKGRRYVWAGWNPKYYQFHREQDYIAFMLKWA